MSYNLFCDPLGSNVQTLRDNTASGGYAAGSFLNADYTGILGGRFNRIESGSCNRSENTTILQGTYNKICGSPCNTSGSAWPWFDCIFKAVRVGVTFNSFYMSKSKGKGGLPSTNPGKKSGGGRDNNPPTPKPKPGN